MIPLVPLLACFSINLDSPHRADFREWADQLEHICNCTVSLVSRTAMPQARYAHTSVLHNDALYIFGGRVIPKHSHSADNDVISPETQAYKTATARLPARDSLIYNITKKQWKVLEFNEKYYTPRLYASTYIYDDRIYIVGGRVDTIDASGNVKQTIADAISVFNTLTMQWEKPTKFRVRNSYFPTVSGAAALIETPVDSFDTTDTPETAESSQKPLVFVLGGYNADALMEIQSEEKPTKTTLRHISSALTKKYGYYAFHAHNRTQAHVFPAFEVLPVYGHQVVVGPDRALLVLGGLQRNKKASLEKSHEEMKPSNTVHLLRHDAFFQNRTSTVAKWPISALPAMNHPRAYFGAVRIFAEVEGGEGTENADFVAAFGGTDNADSQTTVPAVEILDVNHPERGWRTVQAEKTSERKDSPQMHKTFPAHIATAHSSRREFVAGSTFKPVQRIAISGGVSASAGYHRELLLFDVKFGERTLKKRKKPFVQKVKRKTQDLSRSAKLSIGILSVIIFWLLFRLLSSPKSLKRTIRGIRHHIARLVDTDRLPEAPSGIDSFFRSALEETVDEVHERPLDPPYVKPTASESPQATPRSSTTIDHSLFDSLSSAQLSMNTFVETPGLPYTSRDDSHRPRIPPLRMDDTGQLSNISMPRANVSLAAVPALSLDNGMLTSSGGVSSPGLPRGSPLLERSPRPQPRRNPNTNVYADYQLIDEIGTGDDAVVYTAVLVSGELVAVKVIPDKSAVERSNLTYYPFTHEAQVLLSLPPHPNLIQFYAIFPHKEKREIHIVMELIEAGSLHSLLTKITSPFSMATIQRYTQQLIAGLSHLHANGVVHCDVKGENVLIGREGQLKLTDFGQSRRAQDVYVDDGGDGMQRAVWADVWLLGCTILEMLYRGNDFEASVEIPDEFAAGCAHFDVERNAASGDTQKMIYRSCCPCLLHYEKFLQSKKANNERIPEFPFALPEEVDPMLYSFLCECFRMTDRMDLDELACHAFLGGESARSHSTDAHSPRGTPGTAEDVPVDYSKSLNCTIYDF